MTGNNRPNILFLLTDDQRFNTIGRLNNPNLITPAMDSFVSNGTAFTNAYIMGGTCPAVCMPSRAMLMTGRSLFHLHDLGQEIPEDHWMLPEIFRRAGYTTYGIGKWHNGKRAYARCFSHGDAIFFGGMEDHWNVPAHDFDPTGEYPDEKAYRRSGRHSSELFSDSAIRFILGHQEKTPFFMYVAFMAPHDPRTMPKQYLDLYDPDQVDLPPNFLPHHPFDNGELRVRDELLAAFPRSEDEIRRHIADYYAMISHLDAQIGRILTALEKSGKAENTIIILAGDNGLAIGQHGLMGKQNMYEHSLHVPLIFKGPGIPGNKQVDSFAYLFDIYPTLCDLANIPTPAGVEGKSLVPRLTNHPTSKGHGEVLYFAYRDVQRAVRQEDFKLIETVVNGKRTTQLFDLNLDPWEQQNLASMPAYAEIVVRLRSQLLACRDRYGDNRPQEKAYWDGYAGNVEAG